MFIDLFCIVLEKDGLGLGWCFYQDLLPVAEGVFLCGEQSIIYVDKRYLHANLVEFFFSLYLIDHVLGGYYTCRLFFEIFDDVLNGDFFSKHHLVKYQR